MAAGGPQRPLLALGKIAATSLSIGIGASGGVFAPSLFIGATSGMAFGDAVHHLFSPAAGHRCCTP